MGEGVKGKAEKAKNRETLEKKENASNYYSTIQNKIRASSAKISKGKEVFGLDFNNDIPAFITIIPDSKHFAKDGIAGNFSEPFTKFLLNSYEERHNEKLQIFETFGNPAIFFFDKKVTVYSFSGYFIDSKHKNSHNHTEGSWAESFKIMWEDNLRGTKLIENNSIALVSFNGNAIWGYPSNLTINNSAAAPFLAGFSFNMVVTQHKITRSITKLKPITAFMGEDAKRTFNMHLERLKNTEKKINELLDKYNSDTIMSEKDRTELIVLKSQAKMIYSELLKIINTVKVYKNQLNGT